jgi:hypothetical protein
VPTAQYLTGVSGRSYRFGLQIYRIGGNSRSCSNVSTISGSTNSVYEIWRTWDDCLWFQDLMETRYGAMSREKIHRLQSGKGIKKNGMYIHDRASSFESLPPGPDPKSVAKHLHECLPKLTQRQSFFGASRATVDQRHKEFSAFIKAFLDENVPSLIKELREDLYIRDFFGYWRSDYDFAVKNGGRRPKTAPSDSLRDISSFLSTSSVSTSIPRADLPPISPSTSSQRSHTTNSTRPLSDADSVLSAAKSPSSSPGRLCYAFRDSVTSDDEDPSTIGRKTSTSFSNPNSSRSSPPSSPLSYNTASTSKRTLSGRSKNSPSPRSETFNVTSDFPLFLSSSTRELLPTSQPHSPSYATPGLGTLPEDSVLDSPVSNTRRLTLRGRSDLPVNSKRANRNVVILPDADEFEVSSSEGDILEGEPLTPVDGANFNVFEDRSTSCSSPPPSSAFSDLSLQSDGSSWRTSSEQTWPSSASSNDSESGIEIDFPRMTCTDSFAQLEGSLSPPTLAASSSISTLCGSLYGHRRRSLSQPLPVGSIPTDVGEEEDWPDKGEDLMESYLGGSQSIFAPNVRDSLSNYDNVPSDFPDDGFDSSSVISFSTSRERIPSILAPPRALARPRPSGTTPLTRPPPSQSSRRTMSISSSRSAANDDALVVKAVLDDAKVVFRVQCDVSLTELRQRVLEKFAQTEGTLLRAGKFELSYIPPFVGGVGKNRTSTVSSMSMASLASVDWTGALPLRNEDDWTTAIASCGSKITVRVAAYPTPQ